MLYRTRTSIRMLLGSIYILLTKREGRTGRISARGLDSTDRAQRGPYKKHWGPIFSQYGPEQAWLLRDLLHDWKDTSAGSLGTMPGPILREYWTGNRPFWLVDFSYWPSDCLSRVIKHNIYIYILRVKAKSGARGPGFSTPDHGLTKDKSEFWFEVSNFAVKFFAHVAWPSVWDWTILNQTKQKQWKTFV